MRLNIGVSLNEVTENFNDFGLLDGGVHFVRGYFRYSLPLLRAHLQRGGRQLAVLRGDGDMYESYLDTLYNFTTCLPLAATSYAVIAPPSRWRETPSTTSGKSMV